MKIKFLDGTEKEFGTLFGANLRDADLRSANVGKTCLDPTNPANGNVAGFERDHMGENVYGYRTRRAGHIDMYRDGWTYSADWFSTADTECHPGLYLWPTVKMAKAYSGDAELIKVVAPAEHVHKAGDKWRCRWFTVVGGVK